MTLLEMDVQQRVADLEALMAQAWRAIERTSREMRDFKNEMRDFKNEMRDFKDEMRDFKDEMHDFKDEMRNFKDEMRDYRDEERQERIAMRRQWGQLANKMGTMAEDLVAPSVPRILRETGSCPGDKIEFRAVRVRKLHPTDPGQEREFDVLAVCGEYVLINETKSNLSATDVAEFVEHLPEARDFFPEYADKKFIGAIASLYVDASVVRFGEKQGVIVLGFGEDVMEVLNSPGFVPRAF